MKIKLGWIALLLILTSKLNAQDFEAGKISQADINFERETIDSNANAVVLDEFGTSRLQLDDRTGYIHLFFDYHVKIKIFTKDGFNAANIVVPLYKNGDRAEDITQIEARTFNRIDGVLNTTEMGRKAIFNEHKTDHLTLVKFTLPNLNPGSIIEYSYRLESPFLFNFKDWQFQGPYPKMRSEYVAYIPPTHNYNVVLRGPYKLADQKAEVAKGFMRLMGQDIDCSKLTYVMKNMPAFVTEEYMTAPSNFKSAMYFELSDVQHINGSKQSFTKTWKDVDYELLGDKRFGQLLKNKNIYKDIVAAVTKNATTPLEKAKTVYYYIQKKLRWNNFLGQYADEDLKTILDKRTGNVGAINLSLIAALNTAGIPTDAVILSTRENGTVNKLYPVISEFNYVIAKTEIDGKTYFLDATDQLLPFGLLPLRCLNDQGRVLNANSKTPSFWIDLKNSEIRRRNYFFSGKLDTDGKITGQLFISSYGYAAYNKREEIKQHNSTDDYIEQISERLAGIKIISYEINQVDSLEQPLTETYQIEFKTTVQNDGQFFRLNPFFINPIRKNPFNLNERTYPVDMGSALDERIAINLQLPATFKISEQPKDMRIGLPENGGSYNLQTTLTESALFLNQRLLLGKPIYQPEEYLSLKEFYSRIIQNQKTDIVLSKIAK